MRLKGKNKKGRFDWCDRSGTHPIPSLQVPFKSHSIYNTTNSTFESVNDIKKSIGLVDQAVCLIVFIPVLLLLWLGATSRFGHDNLINANQREGGARSHGQCRNFNSNKVNYPCFDRVQDTLLVRLNVDSRVRVTLGVQREQMRDDVRALRQQKSTSRPAFSHSVRGTTCSASPNCSMQYWSRPGVVSERNTSKRLSSSSSAPAPATKRGSLTIALTVFTPSSIARSRSSRAFCVAPRRIMVAVLVVSSVWRNTVHRSDPSSMVSTISQYPASSGVGTPLVNSKYKASQGSSAGNARQTAQIKLGQYFNNQKLVSVEEMHCELANSGPGNNDIDSGIGQRFDTCLQALLFAF